MKSPEPGKVDKLISFLIKEAITNHPATIHGTTEQSSNEHSVFLRFDIVSLVI